MRALGDFIISRYPISVIIKGIKNGQNSEHSISD